MIEKVRFRNFKALREVDLALERFTVLVGPNSSGKTSVLQGLNHLTKLAYSTPESVFQGRDRLSVLRSKEIGGPVDLALLAMRDGIVAELQLHAEWGTEGEPRWLYSVMGRLGETPFSYRSTGPARVPEVPPVASEFSHLIETSYLTRAGDNNSSPAGPVSVDARSLQSVIPPAVLLRFDAARLAAPSHDVLAKLWTGLDGMGLASVLAEIALEQPDRFQEIQEALRAIVPGVQRLRFSRVRIDNTELETLTIDNQRISRPVQREYWGQEILFDMAGAPGVPAHAASEGALLILGLLTAIKASERRRLVLIDDLERGLHPKALGPLVQQLRRLLELDPELQLVATTHSPYLLDHMKFPEVRLTTTQADGSVVCASLVEHPNLAYWKDSMLPGEFWSMVAEDWIKERRVDEQG